MSPILGALSRAMTRVVGSPLAKPVARVVVVAAGLVLLAVIGRVTSAGAFGGTPPAAILPIDASAGFPPAPANAAGASSLVPGPPGAMRADPVVVPLATAVASGAPATASHGGREAGHGSATPDDPVFLNAAAADDLRRLPGIGQKRADAILALRARLGRFHAIEDLLKVKGIGRATLKRLRPLVRLDAPPADGLGDAGSASQASH
jgi:competence protein ComEA